MSSPETKELMKLFKCSTDIATQVVRTFVDSKLLPNYGGSFQQYLEDEKHFFYHQWETKNTACCYCPPAGCLINRTNKMDNWIFNTFYADNGIVHRSHIIKQGGTIQQRCLHKYVTRPIRLDNLDITMLNFLLLSSAMLNGPETVAVETIKKTRNSICHAWSTKCYSMMQLNDIWIEVESAISTLTHPYMRPLVQSQIQLMKKCDVEKEEIELLSNKLEEISMVLDEVKSRVPINSNGIKTDFGNMEDIITQLSLENAKDIKHHITQQNSEAQQVMSQDIKEAIRKETKELEVSFQHAIENLSMTVIYDRQVNILVPQENIKGSIERPVLWQMATPKGWDIQEVEAKLKDPDFQDKVVKIKFVKKGSLILMTAISVNILNDQKAFETAVKSFLSNMVEVCHIDTKVQGLVNIRLHILDPDEVKMSFEVPKTYIQMDNKLSQTDMTTTDDEMKMSFGVPKTYIQMDNKLSQTDMTTVTTDDEMKCFEVTKTYIQMDYKLSQTDMTTTDIENLERKIEHTRRKKDHKKTTVADMMNLLAMEKSRFSKITTGDVKKTTGDVKKTTGDVKKTTGDVKKTTGDVKKTTGDVKKTTGDGIPGGKQGIGAKKKSHEKENYS